MKRLLLLTTLIISSLACRTNQTAEQSNAISVLALGDSYTIGESVPDNQRWPEQLKSALITKGIIVNDLKVIAKTGWRTDDLYNAVKERNITQKYDLVTLLIGVNNQYQKKPKELYKGEFIKNLDQAISKAKSKENVVVLSIPDYAYTPFGQTKDYQTISDEIEYYNDVNQRVSEMYGIKYVNITDITRRGIERKELVAEDGLHPSGECYALFIPRIMKTLGY